MNMETVRAGNVARLGSVSWHWISDRQVFALRGAWLSANASRGQSDMACDNEPQRVPMLDWPADLFAGEMS